MARGRRIISNNPWAICRAAQKRHGFRRKKLESCILKVKKQLGHITSMENSAAMSALSEGVHFCASSGSGIDTCQKGITIVAKGLERRGFMVGAYSRD